MPKRKDVASNAAAQKAQAEESSDEDTDMIDVDFEWFDPQEIDFHGLKMLMRQLFDVDQELFDLSALSNLILSQPGLGSTVKVSDGEVDAKETDPYAFLTVLNLHHHRVRTLHTLLSYITTNTQPRNDRKSKPSSATSPPKQRPSPPSLPSPPSSHQTPPHKSASS